MDEVEIEPSSSLSLIPRLALSESKPPIKYENMMPFFKKKKSTRIWNGRQFEGEESVAVETVAPITSHYLYYH